MKERIELLKEVKGKLSVSDREFALSLISSFVVYGKLTPSQIPWVEKLIFRAQNPEQKELNMISLGDFSGVVSLFSKAKQHLKYPKISLLCGSQKIQLSLSGPYAKYPNVINISDGQPYGSNKWFGRIRLNGKWTQSNTSVIGLEELLKELASDPSGVAIKYGKLSGNCTFCNAQLTDQRSVAVGFGKICASHYGLSDQWNAAYEKSKFSNQTKFFTPKEGEQKITVLPQVAYPTYTEFKYLQQEIPFYKPVASYLNAVKHYKYNICESCSDDTKTTTVVEGTFLCKECKEILVGV